MAFVPQGKPPCQPAARMDGGEEGVYSSLPYLILSAPIYEVVASSKVAELVKNRERKGQRGETSIYPRFATHLRISATVGQVPVVEVVLV
jgi:hypothetical protein